MSATDHAFHEEDGHLVPAENFDFDAVDEKVFGKRPEIDLETFSRKELDAGIAVFRALLQWVWQNGMKNTDGVKIRAIVVCWIFLQELRPMNLTQVARGFGLKKQSIGRWVDEFKVAFPAIKTPHMRHRTKK